LETTKCLVWNKSDLKKLFFAQPTLALGWNAILSYDLLSKLKEQQEFQEFTHYKMFLYGILSGDSVSKSEKKAAESYRAQYEITDQMHEEALKEHGWSLADWERGSKKPTFFEMISENLPMIKQTTQKPKPATNESPSSSNNNSKVQVSNQSNNSTVKTSPPSNPPSPSSGVPPSSNNSTVKTSPPSNPPSPSSSVPPSSNNSTVKTSPPSNPPLLSSSVPPSSNNSLKNSSPSSSNQSSSSKTTTQLTNNNNNNNNNNNHNSLNS